MEKYNERLRFQPRRQQVDTHHAIYHRQEWTLRPQAELIRESPGLKIKMPRSDHEWLHNQTEAIPLLGYHALCAVNREYDDVPGDTIASMDNLLFAIEKSNHGRQVKPIERSLGELTMAAVEHERDILKEILWQN